MNFPEIIRIRDRAARHCPGGLAQLLSSNRSVLVVNVRFIAIDLICQAAPDEFRSHAQFIQEAAAAFRRDRSLIAYAQKQVAAWKETDGTFANLYGKLSQDCIQKDGGQKEDVDMKKLPQADASCTTRDLIETPAFFQLFKKHFHRLSSELEHADSGFLRRAAAEAAECELLRLMLKRTNQPRCVGKML